MTHDEMIAIIQAAKEGKKIEVLYAPSSWGPCDGIRFNFVKYTYRIKPQSLRGEGWINPDNIFPRIWPTKIDEFTIHIRWEQIMEDES